MLSHIGRRTRFPAGVLFGALLIASACSPQPQQNHVERLQLSLASAQLAKGTDARLGVTAIFHDHSSRDVTVEAAWTSADATVAMVTAPGEVRGVGIGSTTLSAEFSGRSAQVAVQVTAAEIVAIQVTPPVTSVAKGLTVAMKATATFTDVTTQDVTGQAEWSSTAPSVATVIVGLVSANAVGTALVTATLQGASASAALGVTAAQVASIEITPAAPSLPRGTSLQLSAFGHLTDSTSPDITDEVTWSIDDPAVAELSGATLVAKAEGSTVLRANLPVGSCTPSYGCETSTPVTVTAAMLTGLTISPAHVSLPAGLARAYTAMGTFTSGEQREVTKDVLWESSAPASAFIHNDAQQKGVLDALAVGGATISAAMAGWVDGQDATVRATTSVTITDAVLVSITVEASPETCREPCGSLALGLNRQFRAMGVFSDGAVRYDLTDDVTWSSSSESVAVVSNAEGSRGLATSVGVSLTGTTITATCPKTLVSGSKLLKVSHALVVAMWIEQDRTRVPRGDPASFDAMGRFTDNTVAPLSASWSADHGVVLAPDCAATLASTGTCGRVADTRNAQAGVATITARMADACNVCQVPGIFATAQLEITDAVLEEIVITPPADAPDPRNDIPARLHYPLTATGTYSDGSTEDVTELAAWGAVPPQECVAAAAAGDVATVTTGPEPGRGVVQGWVPGQVVITASKDGITGAFPMTINRFELLAVQVAAQVATEPAPVTEETHVNYQLPLGFTADFTAMGTYGIAGAMTNPPPPRVYNITGMAVWESHAFVEDAVPIALLALHADDQGLHQDVHAELLGHSALSAEDPHTGKRGETVFESVGAIPMELNVEPSTASIAKGTIQRFAASVRYSNSEEFLPTSDVTWSTGDEDFAVVVDPALGAVKGISPTPAGVPVTVTAVLNGAIPLEATAELVVRAAELLAIRVEPADPTIPIGTSLRFQAIGLYSDTIDADPPSVITSQVVWDSSDHAVAIVSNARGSKGLAISLVQGTVTVTAVMADPVDGDLVSGSTTLTIGPAAVLSIQLAPACEHVLVGDAVQYSATAFYTDGSFADVTGTVTWSAVNAPVKMVEGIEPAPVASIDANGIATAMSEGVALILASDGAGGAGSTRLYVGCRCDCTACEACTCQ